MTGEQCLLALQALSYLHFARVDSNLYDKAAHQVAIRAISSEQMMYRLVNLVPQVNKGLHASYHSPSTLRNAWQIN